MWVASAADDVADAATRIGAMGAVDTDAGTPTRPPEAQGPRQPQQPCWCGPEGGAWWSACPLSSACPCDIPGIDAIAPPIAWRAQCPAAQGAMPDIPMRMAAWQRPTSALSTVCGSYGAIRDLPSREYGLVSLRRRRVGVAREFQRCESL